MEILFSFIHNHKLYFAIMHGLGCNLPLNKGRQKCLNKSETKTSMESANASPTRQKLVQERAALWACVCAQIDDHWPTDGKNNPQPCSQITGTSLICVCLTVRKRDKVCLLQSSGFIWSSYKGRKIVFCWRGVYIFSNGGLVRNTKRSFKWWWHSWNL